MLFVGNQVEDFARYRSALAVALRELGFDVHVALPREGGLEEIRREGFTVHTVKMDRMSISLLTELRCCLSLIRVYRRVKPTIVHHLQLKPALYGGIAARVTGVPAVVSTLPGLGHLFTANSKRAKLLWRIVMIGLRFSFGCRTQRVIFQNPDDRDTLLSARVLSQGDSVVVKGSGVDLARFTPSPEQVGPIVILMAARLLWEKGVREFVDVAKRLRRRAGIRFLLAGTPDPGHPSAIPESTLEHWCGTGEVEWLGWRDDIPALIARSHVVCLPSRYGEGVPRILLEAGASGRPVVATNVPGCREVVNHGRNGFLVAPGDVVALTGAIERLVDDARLRKSMGACGREIAACEFSLDKMTEANLSVYNNLCGQLSTARC
jgi:glycosyltransferase involved in cell wall biosynthesis